jgi:acetyl-CoA decarbonylase/synthase complex subunit delta
VDINLAKQLNVLISQLGVQPGNMVMNPGSAAAGYGFEYIASTIDRVKSAALAQNDAMLQMPIVTPVGAEAWSVKEAVVSENDFPDWGPVEQRGIGMEIATAAADLACGSNAVILRHPASVPVIHQLIAELL